MIHVVHSSQHNQSCTLLQTYHYRVSIRTQNAPLVFTYDRETQTAIFCPLRPSETRAFQHNGVQLRSLIEPLGKIFLWRTVQISRGALEWVHASLLVEI